MSAEGNAHVGSVLGLMVALAFVTLAAGGDFSAESRSPLSEPVADVSPAPAQGDEIVSVVETSADGTGPDGIVEKAEPVDADVSTVTVATTSTTEARSLSELSDGDVVAALETAGFPDLEVRIDGASVTVRGAVPDEVSRRAVLNQIGAVPGVETIVDELMVG